MKVILVGFGHWGKALAGTLKKQSRLWEKPLVFDTSKKARDRAAKEGFPTASSLEEALAAQEIEAMIIAAPPADHYDLAKKGLESGKHVLVEKPFGLLRQNENRKQRFKGRKLFQKAREKEKALMIDYSYIYSPGFQKLKELLGRSKMKSYESLRLNFSFPRRDVDVAEDLIIHDLSMLAEIIPSPPLYASCQPLERDLYRRESREVSQAALASLTGKGWRAFIYASRVFREKQRVVLVKSAKKEIEFKEAAGKTYLAFRAMGKDQTLGNSQETLPRKITLSRKTSLEIMFEEFFRRIKARRSLDDFLRYEKISACLSAFGESMKNEGKRTPVDWPAGQLAARG